MASLQSGKNPLCVVAFLLVLSSLCMWLPALWTPFWGDDYVFLQAAHAANIAGVPWWQVFWPEHAVRFWRPLSQGGYWRLMVALTGGNAFAMHAVNLFLHIAACVGVGAFVASLAKACHWPHARLTAALAGALYASLALHFLPVHWASAINNSLLVLFSSMALALWLDACRAQGFARVWRLASVPILLVLAMLSKESAILTPALLVLASLFAGDDCRRRGEVVTLLVCVVAAAVWLVLDRHFTAHVDAAYRLQLGTNVLRNSVAMIAWLLNVPREAIRMATVGNKIVALAWIAVTALPVLFVWLVAGRQACRRLKAKQWLALGAFAVIGYGPCFLFAWNSYPYYAAISALVVVIVVSLACACRPQLAWLLVLVALSSWIGVATTRRLAPPSLMGRAHWGEQLLRQLQHQPVKTPLWVVTENPHRFYAVGRAGLTWRLRIPATSIHLVRRCPDDAQSCLVLPRQGHWYWKARQP
ncbi:MAG TPA: hypothetical protein VF271_04190 [Rhodanobacteraceae bacterium]